MTTVSAHCESCDDTVQLAAEAITLKVNKYAPRLSFYTFVCPRCLKNNHKYADDHIISLLMSGGIEPEIVDVPAEALEPHEGARINLEDLRAFNRGDLDASWSELI